MRESNCKCRYLSAVTLTVMGLLLAASSITLAPELGYAHYVTTIADEEMGSFRVEVIATHLEDEGLDEYRYILTNIDYCGGITYFSVDKGLNTAIQFQSTRNWGTYIEDGRWLWEGLPAVQPGESAEFIVVLDGPRNSKPSHGIIWAPPPCPSAMTRFDTISPGPSALFEESPDQASTSCACCDVETTVAGRDLSQEDNSLDAQIRSRYEEDFEDGGVLGWAADGTWDIVREPDGNSVYRGLANSRASYTPEAWEDCSFAARIKLVKGVIHLGYRIKGGSQYIIGFTEQSLYLSKTPPYGENVTLESVPAQHSRGRWYDVRIVGVGGKLEIYVNDRLVITHIDSEPLLSGTIALGTLGGSEVYVDEIVVIGRPTSAFGPEWERMGGPTGGIGYDIRVNPENPCIWYVTDAKAGVHMSTNGGRSWFLSSAGITARGGASGDIIPIFSLTIDPHDPETLWAGTQGQLGIYKSIDGGLTWVKKTNGVIERTGISFRGFTVDPRSSDIVYAAAEIPSHVWTEDRMPRNGQSFDLVKGAVYKTFDGGESWHKIWEGDNLARYVLINPDNPDIVYVSTGIFDREAANSDFSAGIVGGVGILKSIDAGESWRVLGLENGLDDLYVGSLFMHPEDPDILLAGTGVLSSPYPVGGVFMTIDGGETWGRVLNGPITITAVEIAEADPLIAYAGGEHRFFRSEDGGISWRIISSLGEDRWGPPGYKSGFPIDFQVDPEDALRLFANQYGGGNFVSSDGGETWRDASEGYSGSDVRFLTAGSDVLYSGTGAGVFRSLDAGDTWEGLSYPPAIFPGLSLAVDPTDPKTLLRGDWEGWLYRSTNGGRTWVTVLTAQFNSGDPNDVDTSIREIVFAPSDPSVVYAAVCYRCTIPGEGECPGNGIYKSLDGGRTWRGANDSSTIGRSFFSIAVDPISSDVVLAGSQCGRLLKTVDGGDTWKDISPAVPFRRVESILIDPEDHDVIFLGTNAAVFKSTDGGVTWHHSSAGLSPEAIIRGFCMDPTHRNVLYAADQLSGVYRSVDYGDTWRAINNGLLNRAVHALAISDDGKTLWAGTNGGGVFRLDLEGMDEPDSTPSSEDRDGDGVP